MTHCDHHRAVEGGFRSKERWTWKDSTTTFNCVIENRDVGFPLEHNVTELSKSYSIVTFGTLFGIEEKIHRAVGMFMFGEFN